VGKKSLAVLCVFVLTLTALAAPFAQAAAEVTRESYKEAVEPICKSNTQADEKILRGVEGKVKAGKLKVAAKQFSRAATALRKALGQLKAVPQPPADEAKLAKWLKYIGTEVELFQRTAKKLNAGDKAGAESMSVRLNHTANQANNVVVGFEFHYCRAEPSKFT